MSARRVGTVALVAIVVIAIATVFGVQYQRAGDRLDRHRAAARAAEADLAAQESALQVARDSAGLTERAVSATRIETAHATNARTWMAGVMTGTQSEVDKTRAAVAEAETARFLVTANANETRACIDGVARGRRQQGGRQRRNSRRAPRRERRMHPHTRALDRRPLPVRFPRPVRAAGRQHVLRLFDELGCR